jgi:hypothetical protein
MKVSNTINTYPDDGDRTKQPADIEVRSHWNYDDRVHLIFGPCIVTVLAADLKRAVDNATNHKR